MNAQHAIPSLRAQIRSEQWMARTKAGAKEDKLDRAARAEFEDELPLLRPAIRDAVTRASARA